MNLRNRIASSTRTFVEELERTVEPDAKSVDNHPSARSSKYTQTASKGSADKHFPNRKKLERYWEIYQQVPIVRHPIRSFASEVIAPGYYVDATDENAKKDLEEWLNHCAIVDGEIDKDFSLLLKKAQIQREVKGTALSEKVKAQDGTLYGFKLMRPETVRAFTKPGQSVLLPPDYDYEGYRQNQSGLMSKLLNERTFYTNERGEVAAYVQLDDAFSPTNDGHYIPFTRNEVIKLTRDSDVGEIFGESRITAIEDRLNSLLKKLDDNDKAIESLSQPFQLFKFGTEENPWEPSEIKSFMEQHSQSEFEPGMKQGVQGDMEVDTISGEVAPINDFLQFDLNWIVSEMPLPKYALGGFEEDVNQFVSRSQETRIEKQINEARQEVINEWTPVIEEKAQEFGYSPDVVETLVIGQDPSELNLSDLMDEDEGSNNTGASGTDFTRPPASSEE